MKRFQTILFLLAALTRCFTLTGSALAAEIAKAGYQMGDVIDDFTLTTPEGDSYTLSALLEKYKAVVLNFWFAGCGPCAMEFPYMEEAYQEFKDDLIILAITPYDENEVITAYKAEMDLTFPMMKDTLGITYAFVKEGFPTTIMVDRKGAYCFYGCGSVPDKDTFVRLFTPFVADDYSESLAGFEIPAPTPPTMPDPADTAVDYTVTFVDADGAPVPGVIANICDDETCTAMEADDKGVIAFSNVPFEYDIHVLKVPDGCACGPDEGFKTSVEGGNLTITIKKAE